MPRDEGAAGARRLQMRLRADAEAPAEARRALRQLPLGQLADDVLLAASELVTNAVEHGGLEAGQQIELDADCREGRTRVEVRDPGNGFARGRAREGHGLHIVAALTQRWGVEHDHGTRVWFELRR